MERKEHRKKGLLIGLVFSLAALFLVALGGAYYYKQAEDLKRELTNVNMRAFHEMADYLDDIDVGLKKTLLAPDAAQMEALSTRLYMQAEAAKTCLSALPTGNGAYDTTSKFLSQVGDYASYLSKKVIEDGSITEEEYKNLGALSDYAEAVSDAFSDMEDSVYEDGMDMRLSTPVFSTRVYAAEAGFSDGMSNIESLPQEYPSLIYDGPFSEHLNTLEPRLLAGKEEVSRHTAENKVSAFLGSGRARHVTYQSDGAGDIETYLFADSEGTLSVELTKQGGEVLWMLDAREVKDERLSVSQAMAKGETFLTQRGYPSMKSSYYDVSDHIATINYAYVQDGVVMYPDLIKLKVALDNGDIVGFEAEGYIMCHTQRPIPTEIISEEEARKKAGTHLSIDAVSMAYIPLESTREVYCYELKGTLGNNNFLIYINAKTGREEKILMLRETERGILTI